MERKTKICPFCGEEIKEAAIKCKYCGEFLNKYSNNNKPETIECPYCGETILSTEIKCPHCEEILNNINKKSETHKYQNVNGIKIITFVIVLILINFVLIKLGINWFNYKNHSSNSVTKADYIGDWDDLYSQRASLSIKDIGNQLKLDINWSDSATNNTNWTFYCDFQETTGELFCNDGIKVESYPMCNGKKMDNTGEADECYLYSKETWKEVKETVKENMQSTFNIAKGNLETAMDEINFMGDKKEVIQNSKNMTLYVKNITEDETLKQCVFYKPNI